MTQDKSAKFTRKGAPTKLAKTGHQQQKLIANPVELGQFWSKKLAQLRVQPPRALTPLVLTPKIKPMQQPKQQIPRTLTRFSSQSKNYSLSPLTETKSEKIGKKTSSAKKCPETASTPAKKVGQHKISRKEAKQPSKQGQCDAVTRAAVLKDADNFDGSGDVAQTGTENEDNLKRRSSEDCCYGTEERLTHEPDSVEQEFMKITNETHNSLLLELDHCSSDILETDKIEESNSLTNLETDSETKMEYPVESEDFTQRQDSSIQLQVEHNQESSINEQNNSEVATKNNTITRQDYENELNKLKNYYEGKILQEMNVNKETIDALNFKLIHLEEKHSEVVAHNANLLSKLSEQGKNETVFRQEINGLSEQTNVMEKANFTLMAQMQKSNNFLRDTVTKQKSDLEQLNKVKQRDESRNKLLISMIQNEIKSTRAQNNELQQKLKFLQEHSSQLNQAYNTLLEHTKEIETTHELNKEESSRSIATLEKKLNSQEYTNKNLKIAQERNQEQMVKKEQQISDLAKEAKCWKQKISEMKQKLDRALEEHSASTTLYEEKLRLSQKQVETAERISVQVQAENKFLRVEKIEVLAKLSKANSTNSETQNAYAELMMTYCDLKTDNIKNKNRIMQLYQDIKELVRTNRSLEATEDRCRELMETLDKMRSSLENLNEEKHSTFGSEKDLGSENAKLIQTNPGIQQTEKTTSSLHKSNEQRFGSFIIDSRKIYRKQSCRNNENNVNTTVDQCEEVNVENLMRAGKMHSGGTHGIGVERDVNSYKEEESSLLSDTAWGSDKTQLRKSENKTLTADSQGDGLLIPPTSQVDSASHGAIIDENKPEMQIETPTSPPQTADRKNTAQPRHSRSRRIEGKITSLSRSLSGNSSSKIEQLVCLAGYVAVATIWIIKINYNTDLVGSFITMLSSEEPNTDKAGSTSVRCWPRDGLVLIPVLVWSLIRQMVNKVFGAFI